MRSAGLDLVKWTAIVTMVADHLRYLWPAADGLFVIGRLAFPLFCLALAINVGRSDPAMWPSRSAARYLGWLLVFGVLSEGPYRWLDTGSQTLNVIPTLTLGLLLAWAIHHRQALACLLGLSAALTAALFSDHLMYGLPGSCSRRDTDRQALRRRRLAAAVCVGGGGQRDQQLVTCASVATHRPGHPEHRSNVVANRPVAGASGTLAGIAGRALGLCVLSAAPGAYRRPATSGRSPWYLARGPRTTNATPTPYPSSIRLSRRLAYPAAMAVSLSEIDL